MNIAFSKIIKINGRNFEFNFRKLPWLAEHFHVDVTGEKGERIFFTLVKKEGSYWELVTQDVPNWIIDATTIIGGAVEEEIASVKVFS